MQKYLSLFAVLTFGLFVFSGSVTAKSIIEDETNSKTNFVAEVLVENESIKNDAASLINTFYLFEHNNLGGSLDSLPNPDTISFFFASGQDFIQERRVNPKALSVFEDHGNSMVSSIPTNSDQCFVQSFVLTNGRITIAIYNEDSAGNEHALACLVAGLWRYRGNSFTNYEPILWREAFIELLRCADQTRCQAAKSD